MEGEDSDDEDGFFVPHGYLSNDEGDCSDTGEALSDDVSITSCTPTLISLCTFV